MNRSITFLPALVLAGCTLTEPTPSELSARLGVLPYMPESPFPAPVDDGLTDEERAVVAEIERVGWHHPRSFIQARGPQPDASGVVTMQRGAKVAVRLDDGVSVDLPTYFHMAIYSTTRGYKGELLVQEQVGHYLLGSLQWFGTGMPAEVGDHAASGAAFWGVVPSR